MQFLLENSPKGDICISRAKQECMDPHGQVICFIACYFPSLSAKQMFRR